MFEKVNPSHPDKIADRIAGAIVDLGYKKNKTPKIAVEVLIGHGHCHIINETSEHFTEDEIKGIVHRIAKAELDVDYAEYKQDQFLSENQTGRIRCGDNGIFRGVPLNDEQKTLSNIARDIYSRYPSDGKYIIDYLSGRLVICQSRAKAEDIREIPSVLNSGMTLEINPLGYWTGGIDVDSGATNRKLGSDMSDSMTGGGLWGKDLSKADITLNLYAWKYAQLLNEKIEIMCAIGDEEVSICHNHKIIKKNYEEIIEEIRSDIFHTYEGFEQFAMWGYF